MFVRYKLSHNLCSWFYKQHPADRSWSNLSLGQQWLSSKNRWPATRSGHLYKDFRPTKKSIVQHRKITECHAQTNQRPKINSWSQPTTTWYKLHHTLRSSDATPVTFYGLPKIHKPDVPLRLITSSINCPTYQVSRYLASILSPLQNNKYTVKNSNDFVEKISANSVDPQEIMVSFDVVSLFTSIPTALALQVTKNRLECDLTISERTNFRKNQTCTIFQSQ